MYQIALSNSTSDYVIAIIESDIVRTYGLTIETALQYLSYTNIQLSFSNLILCAACNKWMRSAITATSSRYLYASVLRYRVVIVAWN